MNAVEIEEAISALVEEPFDPVEFPFSFLQAFGNKSTTIKRLRKGDTNKSDLTGGLLQRSNIHIKVCEPGAVAASREELLKSPATNSQKVKYVLATDGQTIEAELLAEGETLACDYKDVGDHFGFFLPLAGIGTTKQIRENAFDIKATNRFNKLYIELLKTNPGWDTDERREDLNHFFARLIFCFFAEDTNIFSTKDMFTGTIEQMSESDSSNTHIVISKIFLAMSAKLKERGRLDLRSWADKFPHVNGGLFSGNAEVPRFSKIARSYLMHIGSLDWTKINPDIFGSMIQAVADDDERSDVGMHYTSVPNILKLLNPLFLDELRTSLDEAGDNKRKLLNIRNRIAKIRVFDPACGSGNFLVVAYKELRKIEAKINRQRGESDISTAIPLTNFRGIEIRSFAVEIARLALIIAKYQCDLIYRGPQLAVSELLPLDSKNWITCGNALRLNWEELCPPAGQDVRLTSDDLFKTQLDQPEVAFENQGGETYICGNPPFTGTRKQSQKQKSDLEFNFKQVTKKWKNVDYVGAWFLKAALYNQKTRADFAFVATSSFCQGQQVPISWKIIFSMGLHISFAHTPFNWKNLAANNAGVTVVIAGLSKCPPKMRSIFYDDHLVKTPYINAYLKRQKTEIIEESRMPLFCDIQLQYGVYYSKSASLLLSRNELIELIKSDFPRQLTRLFLGSTEFINGKIRYALWISDEDLEIAMGNPLVASRIALVNRDRLATRDKSVNKLAKRSHQFREFKGDDDHKIFVPLVSSERREYFPAGLADEFVVPSNKACYAPNAPLWVLAILTSRLHLVWIATICGRIRSDLSYSNTMGWNTFPIPMLTEFNKKDLNKSAISILLSRESYWPATIADMYDPDRMDSEFPQVREAHNRNDETLERIYIGRRFKNDTERLEKLFELYAKMTASTKPGTNRSKQSSRKEARP